MAEETTQAVGVKVADGKMTGSVQELATQMGIDYQECLAVVKFLEKKGIAKKAGDRKPARGFGRATGLFTIPVGPFQLTLVAVA